MAEEAAEMIVLFNHPPLHYRVLSKIRKMGWHWRHFWYDYNHQYWKLYNIPIGRDPEECLRTLERMEKKRNEHTP